MLNNDALVYISIRSLYFTSANRSLAPLTTFGCAVKPSTQFTNPSSFTTRFTLSRSPKSPKHEELSAQRCVCYGADGNCTLSKKASKHRHENEPLEFTAMCVCKTGKIASNVTKSTKSQVDARRATLELREKGPSVPPHRFPVRATIDKHGLGRFPRDECIIPTASRGG